MDATPATAVADALGTVLQRGFRNKLYAELTRALDESLDVSTYPVISAVARYGPSSAGALASEVGVDRSVVSRRAGRLVQAGYLRTVTDGSDARFVLLELTPKGREAVTIMRERLSEAIARRLGDWPEASQEAFAQLLTCFVQDGPL
ncbi:MAG: MarR family transcriptional regulator [Comamonadaceae bacterium]|nr:MAG: MarR family transcriptional regulator [Comamonadaceae bacterium]